MDDSDEDLTACGLPGGIEAELLDETSTT